MADSGQPVLYEWHLSDVKRLKRPRTVKGHRHVPGAVWFRPL
jgi:hypothetical protein